MKMEKEESGQTVVEQMNEVVEGLYSFKNSYFHQKLPVNPVNFKPDMKSKIEETIQHLQEIEEKVTVPDRAYYYYCVGKVYNISKDFDPKTEEFLSKAVKLNPSMVEAWNELGDSYYKKGEYTEAKNCFQKALDKEKNKVSLRSLSVVMRKEPASSTEDRIKNIETAIEYAKDALAMDPSDGNSWAIMGNNYLSAFFNIKQSSRTLDLAIDSYTRAVNDLKYRDNPDVFYNLATVFKFSENYLGALINFDRAHDYDPEWEDAKIQHDNLLKFLCNLQNSVESKGRINTRKLQKLVKNINYSKHLSVFHPTGNTKPEDVFTPATLIELKYGINERKVLVGVVVCSIQNDDLTPFSFCIVDKEYDCAVVTVYNLAESYGVIIGDVVAIGAPVMNAINFEYNEKRFKFHKIRVCNPMLMIVNGKPMPQYKMASLRPSVESPTTVIMIWPHGEYLSLIHIQRPVTRAISSEFARWKKKTMLCYSND